MDYTPHIAATEPEFLQALNSPAWAKIQQGETTARQDEGSLIAETKPFETNSTAVN